MTALGDRQELRELVDAYALAADRHDGAAAADLFTADAVMTLFLQPGAAESTSTRRGRAEISSAIDALARWPVTHHTISATRFSVAGRRATGEATCVAHHLSDEGDEILFIRYDDTFERAGGTWRFASRVLRVQWQRTERG